MAEIGRNDPCPCGSGRKYKKCCLASDEAAWRVGERERQIRTTVVDRLLAFIDDPDFDEEHIEAGDDFWGGRLDELHPSDVKSILGQSESSIAYNSWFLFDCVLDDGRTAADRFRDEQGRDLDPDELAFLDRMRGSFLSLYEVERVDPGVGLSLVDLWTGARVFVEERLATQGTVQWDLLGARVVPDANGRLLFEGGLYLLPVADKDAILDRFRRLHRRFLKRVPGASDDVFFKRHGHEFNLVWLDYVVLPPAPRLKTADGEDLIFSRVTFQVLDEPRLRAVLGDDPHVALGENGSYTWRAAQGPDGRWLGTWTIASGRLRFEGWSREQADRARQWIEERASSAIRYRITSYRTGLLDAGAAPPPPEETPEDSARVVWEYLDRYYRQWIDEPVPALDGDTPRRAAGLEGSRPKVVDLLKQMENLEARGCSRGAGQDYDFGWIWTELGLTRPDV
ncbi:MAG: SEC-C metal-binding domain-containing protein [Vicinamibacterales bacterium]